MAFFKNKLGYRIANVVTGIGKKISMLEMMKVEIIGCICSAPFESITHHGASDGE